MFCKPNKINLLIFIISYQFATNDVSNELVKLYKYF